MRRRIVCIGVAALLFVSPVSIEYSVDRGPIMRANIISGSLEGSIAALQVTLRKQDRISRTFSGEYLPSDVWSDGQVTFAVQRTSE